MTTGRPVLTTLVAFGGHGFEARKRWEHLALQERGEGDGERWRGSRRRVVVVCSGGGDLKCPKGRKPV